MLAGFESVPWGKSSSAKFRSGPSGDGSYRNSAVENLLNADDPVPMGQAAPERPVLKGFMPGRRDNFAGTPEEIRRQMEEEFAKYPRPVGNDGIQVDEGGWRRVSGKRPLQGINPGADRLLYDGEKIGDDGLSVIRDVTVSDGVDGGGLLPPGGLPFGDDFVLPPSGPDSWSVPGRPTGSGPGGDVGKPLAASDPQDGIAGSKPQSLDDLMKLMEGMGLRMPPASQDTDPPELIGPPIWAGPTVRSEKRRPDGTQLGQVDPETGLTWGGHPAIGGVGWHDPIKPYRPTW